MRVTKWMAVSTLGVIFSLLLCLGHANAQTLPSGWSDSDIGSVGSAGSASYANGTFTVKGAGSMIGGTSDGFHFAYQPLSGDGSIVARLSGLQTSGYPSSAGVMIRETLDAGAVNAYTSDWPWYGVFYFSGRGSTSGSTSNYGWAGGINAPYWLKLVRSGNTFTSYVSPDGISWAQMGPSETITMAQNVYIGLAVSSASSSLGTATFDYVSVNSTASPAPQITGVSPASALPGSQVVVSGANFGAAQGASLIVLNGAATTVNAWSDTSITFTVPAGAVSGNLDVVVAPTMNASNVVSFTVLLPDPWQQQDIGQVSLAGSGSDNNGTFTVKGEGTLIGSTADSFHYVYQPLSGDGTITARVASQQGWYGASVGIMMRETLDANAANAFVSFYPNQAWLSYRGSAGGGTTWLQTSFANPAAPFWVRMIRNGNTFLAYISADGNTWKQVGTAVTVAMAQNIYVGLAVGNNSGGALETATFDYVSINSNSNPAPVITNSPPGGWVGSQVTITGANFGATQGTSVVLLNGQAMPVNSWSDTSITFTIAAGASGGYLAVEVAPP
jgi:regulation of enolase protein 1 (concanavalin A-like superfamily)